ncbi:MAG TPA: alpha/beta fold hydrolase [Dehalococcoidia bacterium]|nr:alpha/beta fold hydrolase [Dehalococcoidia bacterium]
MTAVGRAGASLCPIAALVVALFLGACAEEAPDRPPTPVVGTAEALSRDVRIVAVASETPESGEAAALTPIALDARVFGSGPAGVILVHMRPVDQVAWYPMALQLAASGQYTVMTFDFRGYGASTGEKDFESAETDVAAAYAYMRDTLHRSRVFLVGASVGATAMLIVAARVSVAGVVAISALDQFEGLDAAAAVPRIAAPRLFIASTGDVPARRGLERLITAAGSDAQEQLYDGNAHGTDLFAGPHAAALSARIAGFLASP